MIRVVLARPQAGGHIKYRIALATGDGKYSNPLLVQTYAHTILHEIQHKRIISYSLSRFGSYKWNTDEQHYIMTTNKTQNYFYDFDLEMKEFNVEIGKSKTWTP